MKVAFLDRDGVINVERGDYTWKIEDFEFVEGFFESIKILAQKGFEFIVITNQGGIAKGLYSHQDVEQLNEIMRKAFQQNGFKLLDVFYSPYHSDYSESLSRKPDSLMLEKAIALYNVNVAESFMVGDSERDIIAAQKAGIKGIKVDSNQNLVQVLSKHRYE